SRSEQKLLEVKNELEKDYSVEVVTIPLDLSLKDSAEILFQRCEEKKLNIDILINNAGIGLFEKSIENSMENIEKLIFLNALTPTKLCSLFGKKMAERKDGNILNVGSMGSLISFPFFAVYSAAKSYILSYSISLRSELKKYGVNVTCLLPGYVKTHFDDNSKIESERYRSFSKRMGMAASKVAEIGIKAMFKKKAYEVAGLTNKILSFIIKFIPRTIVAEIVKKSIIKLTDG
ncbi:MAG: SDR family NAD(P)-dependent oxidoreductase, partial [Chitinispirillaceae bacterium]|nr:SDR family NAD(P)-dependent oxidoreductase [Chitinispirillaceae bacterium]